MERALGDHQRRVGEPARGDSPMTLALLALLATQQGLWAVDTTFGPAVRGDLTVRRDAMVWARDAVRFALPGDSGQFRGRLTDGVIRGFWIQPPGVTLGQSYASPLVLRSTGRDRWRGTVAPLADRFRGHLAISRGADGTLVGVFRKPEMNAPGGAPQFAITRETGSLRFTIPGRQRQPAR